MASLESLWDIIIHFLWHTVLLPLLPKGPACPHLFFDLADRFFAGATPFFAGIWTVVRFAIPHTEPIGQTTGNDFAHSNDENQEHPAVMVQTVSGWLAVAAVAMWGICYLGKSYTETPEEKEERLQKEKKKRDEESQ
ncbi:hypothetical protein PG996_006414 [Apiospora saccharicola]|uniref:Uncharacterized protein n=1 Tax=Apiospora saccharicola TaxID=335842 RepID=A0ABR1VP90_9PEZI